MRNLDREAITEYESKVKELRKQADDVVRKNFADILSSLLFTDAFLCGSYVVRDWQA